VINGWRAKTEAKDQMMADTLTVKITESGGEIHDLRYRFIWSAWISGELLGKGHAFKPEEAIAKAQDLIDPEGIEHIEIDYRGQDCFDPCR
jgi:hypothetical protein